MIPQDAMALHSRDLPCELELSPIPAPRASGTMKSNPPPHPAAGGKHALVACGWVWVVGDGNGVYLKGDGYESISSQL